MPPAATSPLLSRLALATPLLLFALAAPNTNAQAQIYVGPWGPHFFSVPYPAPGPYYRIPRERRLHPALILDELEDRGFRDLVVVARRPDVYVIEGVSARREPVRLIVDAFDGEILERFSRGAPRNAALPSRPLPLPPQRRMVDPAAKSGSENKVALPGPGSRTTTPAPAPLPPARPRGGDWAPINSVPVAPLE